MLEELWRNESLTNSFFQWVCTELWRSGIVRSSFSKDSGGERFGWNWNSVGFWEIVFQTFGQELWRNGDLRTSFWRIRDEVWRSGVPRNSFSWAVASCGEYRAGFNTLAGEESLSASASRGIQHIRLGRSVSGGKRVCWLLIVRED